MSDLVTDLVAGPWTSRGASIAEKSDPGPTTFQFGVPGAVTRLVNRRSECSAFDRLLEAVREGRSGALVVRGEAGVGKTALLNYAIDSAPDLRVLRAVGVETEMELAYGALHQLCVPMLDRLEHLPAPQRDALSAAFALEAGPVPDRFLIGLAALSLLSEEAQERPLVCVVDDVQWLDRSSAQALGFVARRLGAESVVLLFGAREPGEELRGLPELMVEGLSHADARELLDSVVPWPLDEPVREQIVAETRGNPLALLELPRGLGPVQVAGGFGLPAALSLEDRLEESFLQRLEGLPEDTRRLLLLAAAEPAGDPDLVWRAAERLAITGPVLDPAESAGLLEIGARVRFRHPLMRSAVYRAASPEKRREVHRALAEATDAEADPDRRAWHLAEATAGPDEQVAAELERSAGRAQVRGGLAAAAAFLERAVALTPESSGRTERALAAAQIQLQAGAFEGALRLLGHAEAGPLDEVRRAQADLLRAQVAYAQRRSSDAPALLLRAAKQLEPLVATVARATYRDALTAASWADSSAGGVGVLEVAQAVEAATTPERPSPGDLLLQGVARQCTECFAAGVPMLRQALAAIRHGELRGEEQLEWSIITTRAAVDLWDDESWYVMASRYVELARATGALPMLQFALDNRIIADAFAGALAAGSTRMEDLHVVCQVTGSELPAYGPLALAAWSGREADASKLIAATTREALARGDTQALSAAQWAAAVLHNGLGRYQEALAAAERAVDDQQVGFSGWSLAELVLAAARSGDLERAADAHQQLAARAHDCGSDWALGIEARSRALLTDGDIAESLYREAIERLERTRVRVELARANLLYGEWLRRERRRVDAREQLRTAHEMFTAMGVEALADCAARELLATGEHVRRRSVETRDELTAQEAQIAGLASDGLSNPEIGARLFISPRTVEYHLHKVFGKLGISSRNQLQGALPREPIAELAV